MNKLVVVACAAAVMSACSSYEPMNSQDTSGRSASTPGYSGGSTTRSSTSDSTMATSSSGATMARPSDGTMSTSATTGGAMSTTAAGATMSSGGMAQDMEFKMMDANGDGWVSRDEYVRFYGMRHDRMKRNDKGMVSWQDMQAMDGKFFQPGTTSNTTGNPVTNRVGTSGGVGNPPATGGGSK